MKNLISISLLSVYSIVLVHTMLPHFHFDDESSNSEQHVAEHQHHEHDQHHDHNQDKHETSALAGFLNFLGHLGHHEHAQEHVDNFIANINSSASTYSDVSVKQFVVASAIINCRQYETERLDQFDTPPILYELLNSSSDPHRGPPSIA